MFKNLISNLSRVMAYNGFFKMEKVTFDQKKFNGEVMENVVREVFTRRPVVFLALFDPKTKMHLITEQVRVGAIICDEVESPLVLEPIAGIIDEGETPLEAAVREAKEETGLDVDIDSIKIIQKGFTSPGGSSEYAYFATGLFDSANYIPQEGGVEGEQEDIRSHLIEHDKAMEMISNGEINSISTALGIYWHNLNS